jgi:hypothetical protein
VTVYERLGNKLYNNVTWAELPNSRICRVPGRKPLRLAPIAVIIHYAKYRHLLFIALRTKPIIGLTLKIALLLLSIALLVAKGNETVVVAQETDKKGNNYTGTNSNESRFENLISINQEDPIRFIINTLNILHK